MSDLSAEKRIARREARRRAGAIPQEAWHAAGCAMAQRLFSTPEWRAARSVFSFVSMDGEPDTRGILARALAEGKRLSVPRLEDGRMVAVSIGAVEDLVPGRYGILEPCWGDLTEAGEIDLVVVPCLAVTRRGVRLGRGGGYYDRFLPECPGWSACLCPEEMLAESLPAGECDKVCRAVLTERELYRVI